MVRQEKIRDSVHIHIGALEHSEDNGRIASGSSHNVPRTNQVAPTQVDEAAATEEPRAAAAAVTTTTTFTSKLFKLLFFAHLLVLAVLVAFLSIRGYFTRSPTFRLARYFIPLLSSVAFAALASLLCLLYTLNAPAKSLKHSLWMSPLSTCLLGVLLMVHSTATGFAFGALALALAAAQSLYACWVAARLPYAYRLLSASVSNVSFSVAVGARVALALAVATAYSFFWTLGPGGLAASADAGGRSVAIYLLLLLLSLAWTMQVIKNVVHVAVSHVAHARLVRGAEEEEVGARDAFDRACSRAFGDVCVGSAVTPLVGFVRGTARTMGLLAGGADEFMFSCTECYRGVADRMVEGASRWGFVHVGAYGKGFVEASEDTWGMFRQQGMESLIDLDLTGSFCFLSGTAVGAASALIGGSWMLVVDDVRATGVTVYAFVVGYFIMRIAMAWPQSCVSAYHVAYAEDPPRLDSTIPDRLRELERSSH